MNRVMSTCIAFGCWALLACGSTTVSGDPGGGDAGVEAGEDAAPDFFRPVCGAPLVITVGNGAIDDFESGATRWFTYQDGTGTLMGTTVNGGPPEPNAGEIPGSMTAAHISGSGFTDFGAGLSFSGWLACVDVSAFAGISFWAKGGPGTGTTLARGPRLNLLMPETLPAEFGGTCMSTCNDYHNSEVLLTEQWKQYFITWSLFSQYGFGPTVPFDNKKLLGFNLVFLGTNTGTAFDFWLDNVQLFK
jgi:hypothetical protein